MNESQLRVVSLNMWGLGMNLSQDRPQRMRALGDAFHTLHADIIGLQEIWLESDQKYLIRQAQAAGMPYAHYFRSGMIGSGVLTLSRHPIIEAIFQPYRLSSRPECYSQGDYYAGKGMGLARIQTPYGVIDVYNTHAIAQYAPDYQDELAGARASNMYDAANFINAYSHKNPAILLGDLNVNPHQLGYRLLNILANLSDCYESIHPDDASITFSLDNPYNRNYREPERIDYVAVRDGAELALTPMTAEITLTQQPDYPYKPYSDHYAVMTDLAVQPLTLPHEKATPEEIRAVLEEFSKALHTALDLAVTRKKQYRRRAILGLAGSLFLHPRILKEHNPPQKHLRLLGALGALVLAVIYAILGIIFADEEIQILKGLNSEVRLKIIAIQRNGTPEPMKM